MAKLLYRTAAFVLLALLGVAHLTTAAEPTIYTATLEGANQRPPVMNTTATGKSELRVYDEYARLNVSLSNIKNLTAAHIHFTGVNSTNPEGSGPPVLWVLPFIPLQNLSPFLTVNGSLSTAVTFNGTDLQGSVYPPNATAAAKFRIFRRWAEENKLYINAHTTMYPNGEIRGNFAKRAK